MAQPLASRAWPSWPSWPSWRSSSRDTYEPLSAATVPRPRVRCSNDDAAVLIEFALLLPFLTIIVFGTIDLGRAYQYKNRVTNMAREGSAFAQYAPTYFDSCPSRTIKMSALVEDIPLALDPNFGGVTAATVTYASPYVAGSAPTSSTPITGCSGPAIPSGSRVRVIATYNFKPLTPLVSMITGPTKTLTGFSEVTVQG